MPREKYQRGSLKKVGRHTQHWKGLWYVYDAQNNRHHRSKVLGPCASTTKGQARAELDKIIQAETSQTPAPAGNITVAQLFSDIYLPVRSKRWSFNTQVCMAGAAKNHILPALGDMALKDLTKAHVEKHLIALADRGLGCHVIDRVLFLLRSGLEEALDNGHIDKNPARKAQAPRMDRRPSGRSLTETEVKTIFARLTGKDRLVYRLMLVLGLRPGEAFTLRRNDLLPDGLRIDESWDRSRARIKSTKTERVRILPLPSSLRTELDWWLGARVGLGPDALLFPNRQGKPPRHQSEREMVNRARKLTGIPDLDWRICRRTFGTLFRGDIRDAQEILGHASIEMTLEHYRKPIPERLRQAVEELDSRLSGVN